MFIAFKLKLNSVYLMSKILFLFFVSLPIVIIAAESFPVKDLQKSCKPFTKFKVRPSKDGIKDCKVSKYGDFGTVDGLTYSYVLYCLIPNFEDSKESCGDGSFSARYNESRALAIFTRKSNSGPATMIIEKAGEEIGVYQFEKPEIYKIKKDYLLFVPVRVDGTANANESEYLIRRNKKWVALDTDAWFKEIENKFPPDTSIKKGVWPDLKLMKASFGLYKKGDSNSTPTGGTVIVDLELAGDKLITKKFVVEPYSEGSN